MKTQTKYYQLPEGRIILPEGYLDRTVNVFSPPKAGLPAFNITRDTPGAGETLTAYLDRQLALMAQHLSGWHLIKRGDAALGENLFKGETVYASYTHEMTQVFQQQAVFAPDSSYLLIFTMAGNSAFSDDDNAQFNALLSNFTEHA